MIKTIILGLLLFFSSNTYCFEVEIEVSPKNPVKGESFKIIFNIKSQSDTEPFISFDNGGLNLIEKHIDSVSKNITIINGKISSTKVYSISYDVMGNSAENFIIKDITIEIDGETKKIPSLRITVFDEKKIAKDVFLLAIPSKQEVYIGEGINVDYFLYYRVPVVSSGINVLQYPILKLPVFDCDMLFQVPLLQRQVQSFFFPDLHLRPVQK